MKKDKNEMNHAEVMNVLSNKARLETAKQRFREKWEYVLTTLPDGPEHAYAKDFDPVRAERRAEAIVNMMDAAKSLVSEICPDIPGVFSFEDDWMEHNLMPFHAYDYLEGKSHVTLACAIFLLDELLMQEVSFDGNYRFPSLEQMRNEIVTPGVWDSVHDIKSLITMVWIVQHRNDDCSGMTPGEEENVFNRFFMDQYTAAGMLDQKVASRKRFRHILKMVPQESIDQAVELYKATFEDVLERTYRCRAILAKRHQGEDQAAMRQEIVDFRSMLGSICVTPPDVLAHWYGPEVAEVWADFEILDPYALSFAFLYLLETGDDMPWVYSVSLPLMEMCASVLPWGNEQLNDDGDSRLDHYLEEAALAETSDLGDWFSMVYENVDEMDMSCRCSCNLAQIIYWTTEGILPRNVELIWENQNSNELFGERALRDLEPHSFWMHIIEAYRSATPVFCFASSAERKLEEEEEACVEEAAYDAYRYRRELVSMRNLVLSLRDGSYEDDTPDEDIDLPCTIDKDIAVFGGDGRWAEELSSMLENITFIDQAEDYDPELICGFDAIWIQTEAMSNRAYLNLVDLAHLYDIPVEYFSYASAVKCAEQLVVYDTEE